MIYVSAALHDMCDKKYMNEKEGVDDILSFLENKLPAKDISDVSQIITTMSYSKVKRIGFPQLGVLQQSYHIVREADLLAAYDFDRSMIFHMRKSKGDITDAFHNAESIFKERILQQRADQLFFSKFAKRESVPLHYQSMQRMTQWRQLVELK